LQGRRGEVKHKKPEVILGLGAKREGDKDRPYLVQLGTVAQVKGDQEKGRLCKLPQGRQFKNWLVQGEKDEKPAGKKKQILASMDTGKSVSAREENSKRTLDFLPSP